MRPLEVALMSAFSLPPASVRSVSERERVHVYAPKVY